jgi:O-antigen/teichoic acid export membrane protein
MADEQSTEDRELIELLNELRVALPGVQVLFAFLLAVPFTQRFEQVTRPDKVIFTGIVVTTALAAACLIAPSAQHRLLWRRHQKERLLRVSNRLAILGMALLAVSMSSVVWFVVDFVYDGAWAAVLTAVVAAAFCFLWYVVPIIFLVQRQRDAGGADGK